MNRYLICLFSIFLTTALHADKPVRPWSLHEGDHPYALPLVEEAKKLIDGTDARPADLQEALLSLRFIALREHPQLSGPGEVTVQIRRREGVWEPSMVHVSADYNQVSQNQGQLIEWEWDDETRSFRGQLEITIGPDQPRPRVTGIPQPADQFRLHIEGTFDPEETLPYLPMREFAMAPWRIQTPIFSGFKVNGQYSGQLGETVLSGEMIGSISQVATPGKLGLTGLMALNPEQPEEGTALIAHLPSHRVAAHSSGSAVYIPGAEDLTDWEDWDGLRLTISSPRNIPNAGIQLSIQEEGGVAYHVNQAAPLIGRKVTTLVPFHDFRGGTGGTYFLDLEQVASLSIGVSNPFGIGSVPFTLHSVELVRWGDGYRHHRRQPVNLSLDPATVVGQEGVSEVPPGLFGFHMVGGIRAAREGEPSAEMQVASLNPGLLRPLTHTGFNPGTRISDEEAAERLARHLTEEPTQAEYRLAKVGNALEKVIWCHTQDLWNRPGWMDGNLEQVVENIHHYYRNLASRAWTPGDDFNILRAFEVWNEPFMWGRHFNMGHRQPPNQREWTDPTQYGYIPAEVGTEIYARIFNAAAEGAKSVNPHVTMGGPSSPSFNGNDFGVLADHVLPFVRHSIDHLDFITEHHYGGYRQAYAASFDVLTAYLDTRYNKRLPIINTETNDLGGNSLDKAHYNIEDILASILAAPDRNRGRSLHALWDGYLRNIGEVHAYQLMSTLRGQILDARSSDPSLMFLATHPSTGKVVGLMFNNSRHDRVVTMPIPEGFTLTNGLLLTGGANLIAGETVGDTEGMDVRRGSGDTLLREVDPGLLTDGENLHFVLPSRSGLRIFLEKEDFAPTGHENWEQHFADTVLEFIGPGETHQTTIHWGERFPTPDEWKEVRLRLITTGVDRGEVHLELGEKKIPLPRSTSNFSDPVIQEIDLPRETWEHLDKLVFVTAEEKGGFRLLGASIRTLGR